MTANILVVDDLERNVKLLEAKLMTEYYNVFGANSGLQALEILKNNKIDVILLDVMMPEMDGFDTCRRIKEDPKTAHIPIIMVTALSDVENRIKCLEIGADEFLTKPLNDRALFARVKSLSRMKSIIDELKLRNKTNEQLGESLVEFSGNISNSKILIINDDIVQSKSIEKMLQHLSQNIVITKSLKDTNLLENYLPDLIIISGHLEEEDPLRTSVLLRSKDNFKNSALMLSTEEENMHLVIKAMELGINDYFIYPVDESELLARVKTQLKRKKYQDDLRSALDNTFNLSIKDGLTNIFNRRYFDIHIQQIIKTSNEDKKELWLLMFDIDHFKKINDNYGHQAGDYVLKKFAEILKNTFRVTDLISRYGGEEFTVLVYDLDEDHISKISERVRLSIESTKFELPDKVTSLNQTVSIGFTKYQFGESVESFIGRADTALYKAKNEGRNRVIKS